MDVDLAKDLYDFEWELRDKLTGWLQTPITTLTVLAAALAYLVGGAAFESQTRAIAFYSTIAAYSAAWMYGVYSVARSFWGYTYEKLPRLSALIAHYSTLDQHFAKHPNQRSDADKEFRKYLVRRMAGTVQTHR